jgi:hypothetical protein
MNWDNYPRTKRYLRETGYSLDQALIITEEKLRKIKQGDEGRGRIEKGSIMTECDESFI